jgi:hypothetical protein
MFSRKSGRCDHCSRSCSCSCPRSCPRSNCAAVCGTASYWRQGVWAHLVRVPGSNILAVLFGECTPEHQLLQKREQHALGGAALYVLLALLLLPPFAFAAAFALPLLVVVPTVGPSRVLFSQLVVVHHFLLFYKSTRYDSLYTQTGLCICRLIQRPREANFRTSSLA